MAIQKGDAETAIGKKLADVQIQPNFVQLARETGVNTQTLWEAWRRMVADGRIKVTVEVREVEYKYRRVQ